MEHVYIIAEAGVNHNGSLELAKRMVTAAKQAGADAVKFQTFITEELVTKDAQTAQYQKENTGRQETQFEMLKRLELSYEDYKELKLVCDREGIDFLSTPFDLESIEILEKLNVDKFKIPSGEITNYPYLVRIAQTRKPLIVSSGMCTLDEIADALKILGVHGAGKISLLHCTTDYPAPYEDVNLKAMEALGARFGITVGYSDHTQGIEIAIAAVALGAQIIEKHFTLDRNMEGPDHKASLEPAELEALIRAVRHVEKALGNAEKKPSEAEMRNKEIVRKSIVAKRDIKAGETFSGDNLVTKRPGTGISPMLWETVIGQKAKYNFKKDEQIRL